MWDFPHIYIQLFQYDGWMAEGFGFREGNLELKPMQFFGCGDCFWWRMVTGYLSYQKMMAATSLGSRMHLSILLWVWAIWRNPRSQLSKCSSVGGDMTSRMCFASLIPVLPKVIFLLSLSFSKWKRFLHIRSSVLGSKTGHMGNRFVQLQDEEGICTIVHQYSETLFLMNVSVEEGRNMKPFLVLYLAEWGHSFLWIKREWGDHPFKH